jgi:hypothetical protein
VLRGAGRARVSVVDLLQDVRRQHLRQEQGVRTSPTGQPDVLRKNLHRQNEPKFNAGLFLRKLALLGLII